MCSDEEGVGEFEGRADGLTRRDGRFYKRYGNRECDRHFYYKNIPPSALQAVL